MNDAEILAHIQHLLDEEHTLLTEHEEGSPDAARHKRLQELKVSIDQDWDLLRQRRALRATGTNPGEAHTRDEAIVENYRQ